MPLDTIDAKSPLSVISTAARHIATAYELGLKDTGTETANHFVIVIDPDIKLLRHATEMLVNDIPIDIAPPASHRILLPTLDPATTSIDALRAITPDDTGLGADIPAIIVYTAETPIEAVLSEQLIATHNRRNVLIVIAALSRDCLTPALLDYATMELIEPLPRTFDTDARTAAIMAQTGLPAPTAETFARAGVNAQRLRQFLAAQPVSYRSILATRPEESEDLVPLLGGKLPPKAIIRPYDPTLVNATIDGISLADYADKLANTRPNLLRVALIGPPGVSKTETAGYLAKRMGKTPIELDPENVLAWKAGDAERNLRALFDRALDNGMIILNECESLVGRRESASQNWEASLTNTILKMMDGHAGPIAATSNHWDLVSRAFRDRMVHTGRCDTLTHDQFNRAFKLYFGHTPPHALDGIAIRSIALCHYSAQILGITDDRQILKNIQNHQKQAEGQSLELGGFPHQRP